MLLPLALATSLVLQDDAPLRQAPSPADSIEARRRAERAQADFERTRRMAAPLTTSGSGGRCDVRVGRFCYWYDEAEPPGPEEPERTTRARERLLARLDTLGALAGADPWIRGQRVRYLVEHGRAAEAAVEASACVDGSWWCDALEGFARHAAGAVAAAEAAYERALAAMPERERCAWNDLSLVLHDDLRKPYERKSCTGRADFERAYWALARPLWLRDGNDARVEHFARATMARLQRESRSVRQMAWGDDAHELLVRYGWSVRWSREPPSPSGLGDVRLIGHDETPSFAFAPAGRALEAPLAASAGDWSLHDARAHSRYAPVFAKGWSTLPHQLAMFRRGDSALVVAAWDLTRDTLFRRDSLRAALALVHLVPDSVTVVRRDEAGRTGVIAGSTRWGAVLASVEAWDSAARVVSRARLAHAPPASPPGATVTLSDLLLIAPGDGAPASLDEALPRAIGRMQASAAQGIGAYWEAYGATGAPLDYTLTVRRADESWMRRAGAALGVVARQAPVHMRWQDPPPRPGDASAGAGLIARALHVDLSALPPGRYVVTLSLTGADGGDVSAEREILVVR